MYAPKRDCLSLLMASLPMNNYNANISSYHLSTNKEKKMSKKLLYNLLAMLVLASLVLTACGAQAPAATEPPAKKVWTYADMTIGFLQTGSEGGWRAANTASFKESAEQLGLNLK